MFARFFIDRPIFASVLSILIVLAGLISYFNLPQAQYPDVSPPTIFVMAQYPGADAQTVSETVAIPLEEQINGVEDMLYMESVCTNDGQCRIIVTFKVGVDLNMAQVLVQNRVGVATPKLPEVTRTLGVTTKKRSPTTILYVNFFSDTYDQIFISNYIRLNVLDVIARLPGVGDTTILGEKEYSMRIWLDPDKMKVRKLAASDIAAAVENQNTQVAAGQLGQQPLADPVMFQYILRTQGRLPDKEAFEHIIVKADKDGRITKLRDVARIEIGAKSIDVYDLIDGDVSILDKRYQTKTAGKSKKIYHNLYCSKLSVSQLPGANALDTARVVKKKMAELSKKFPSNLNYTIVFDTTPFIEESISEVQHTLRDAVILVALVVLLFLQSWRAAIIPLIAVPVSLIGTFTVMSMLGFSLNNLSLFGLVLAIGIVVDDAIVVVENVERHMEEGLSPKDAARKAMDEVSGALVAIALVLCCVFVPCAFLSGVTGQFFKQFALTIAVSTVISAFNSLTLSPALSAILLKPKDSSKNLFGWIVEKTIGSFFRLFNRSFQLGTSVYVFGVKCLLRISFLVLIVYGGLLCLTYKTFTTVPTGFIPTQDRGYLMMFVQLPDSASLDRTKAVVQQIQKICFGDEKSGVKPVRGVRTMLSTIGMSFLTMSSSSNMASITLILDSFEERKKSGISDIMVQEELTRRINEEITRGSVRVVRPAPVDGMGMSSGFKMQLQDTGNQGVYALQVMADDLIEMANKDPRLKNILTQYRANSPQKYVFIDRKKAIAMGTPVEDVFNALQTYLGSKYVNDLTYVGRNFQVKVQADGPFRSNQKDLNRIHVKNIMGKMVPLGSLVTIKDYNGPLAVNRFNMFPSAAIIGAPAEGISSGESLAIMEDLCRDNLPNSMNYEWSELALLEKTAGNTALLTFFLAIVFVFLVLAALYESWTLPLAIIMVVPMCLLSSLFGVLLCNLDMNIFTQIGFLVLVGLACKNAILIVEFAKAKQNDGLSRVDATLEACRLRIRPIIMTSLAFILGVVPLLISSGAGHEMRYTLGVAVFSGMIGVTLFGIFLTPVFYSIIQMIFGKKTKG
ncbi:MAG: multidrug efflux RND transporter permease subunit [Planctomycetia bacterium]|nr:multidrug efflux RND transporter permease subunit [Planctomycetia bacterium]